MSPAKWWDEARDEAAKLALAGVAVLAVLGSLGFLLAHPLAAAGFSRWEGGVDRYFAAAHRSPGWNTVTNIASLAGDTPTIVAVAALAFIALRPLTHRWRESVTVAVAMLGEVSIFFFTTLVSGRDRPAVAHLDGSPPTSSFPSGHTAASTVLYGLLDVIALSYARNRLLRTILLLLAASIVTAIGMSRLYRGMHYPTDVLGGILLGLLWLTAVSIVLLRAHRPAVRGG